MYRTGVKLMKLKRIMIAAVTALLACVPAGCGTKPSDKNTLFDSGRVHTIEIQIDEADWADLLAHLEEKTKYEVRAVIDGETVEHVAFSAKGNSSLAFTKYRTASSRCSFKLNFEKYTDGGTFHGLSKLNLNSGFTDVSYLKEYLAYELFRRMNVPAPLCSFVMV